MEVDDLLSHTASMEVDGQDERYLQEVYLSSPGNSLSVPETVAIPTRWDADAGYLILLSDVQLVFKNARRFLDNGEIVPFLKDNGLQE
jgi:hypothetical protein